MLEYDISIDEVTEAYNRRAKREEKVTTAPKAALPARYKNADTGDTWTGRGRPPRWIVDAEAKGIKRDKFLIEK